jgi:hypothetical protein
MHQTTVRFGSDLWEALEAECAQLGVSVAQFVRESALARLAYLAGRRGDLDYERALGLSTGVVPPGPNDPAASARDRSAAEISESSALWAQSQQARRRAQELRDERDRVRQTR